MSYRIDNLASQQILILLNNNALLHLEPEESVAALPNEEIQNNFVVQKLEEWGLIAVNQIHTGPLNGRRIYF